MRRFLSLLCLLLPLGCARAEQIVTLASDPWPRYVDAEGGYLVELGKTIFAAHGYRLQMRLVPFSRATALLASGSVDMVPALYRANRPGVRYADICTAIDETSVVINTTQVHWTGRLRDLDGKTVAWMRGFDYASQLQRQLSVRVRPYEVNDRLSGLAMLREGRVDAFMDNSGALLGLARKLDLNAPNFVRVSVFRKPLYFGFSDTPRGRLLKAIFDRELARMRADGRLQAMYRRMVPDGPALAEPSFH